MEINLKEISLEDMLIRARCPIPANEIDAKTGLPKKPCGTLIYAKEGVDCYNVMVKQCKELYK